ncbi:MAG: sugar kinase [Hyphomicrobiales bacterium]
MKKLSLLAIGEVMAEIRKSSSSDTHSTFQVGFAGDTFNTAVYCKRTLADRGSVGYFTRVGKDSLSTGFVEMAKREALDVSHVVPDPNRLIGIYSVTTDETGERSFSYWREHSAARQLFSDDEAIHQLPDASIYYLSGITLAILSPPARARLMNHLSKVSDTKSALVAFDSNYRPGLWENQTIARQVIGDMWDIADIALPSIDDEMELFNDASEDAVIIRFAKRNWNACAIKRGVRGPVTTSTNHKFSLEFSAALNVVDTTAAGDSFNGGYLASLLRNEDEAARLRCGHNIAVEVVGKSGAIIPKADDCKD